MPTTPLGTEDRPREALGKGRIEAFSDGVFAIAITLLVLALNVPDGLNTGQFHLALRHLGPKLYAFGLSFAIVGVYWVAHHLMYSVLRATDRTLLWLNNLFLLFVSAVPFSASVLGTYPGERDAVILYGANLVAASSALQLLWSYATFRGRLLAPGTDPGFVRGGTVRTLTAAGVYGLAIGISFVSLPLSRAVYLLMPMSYIFLQALVDRHRRPQRLSPVTESDASEGD